MYTVQETEDVLCVELDTPERNRDTDDGVKLGGKLIHTDQGDLETSKGSHSKEGHGEENQGRALKGVHPGVTKGSHSQKQKGKKRKWNNEDEGEGQDEPKLTSKQVNIYFDRNTLFITAQHLFKRGGVVKRQTPEREGWGLKLLCP